MPVETNTDTPISKRLKRMKGQLREMSEWCRQLMREEDLEQDEELEMRATQDMPNIDAIRDIPNDTSTKLWKGTTIMAMLVHDGVVLVSDSKAMHLETSKFSFKASKVTEITPSIYTAGAGIAFKTVTASEMLQKYIRKAEVYRMAETSIAYAAKSASKYLCDVECDLPDLQKETVSYLLVVGYDECPCAYLVWDRARGIVEPIDSFRVVGSGGVFAEAQLGRDGLSELQIDLSVGQAIPYIRRAFYQAYLKDDMTGGVCSGYYIHAGGSELILHERFEDMHIDLTQPI